MDLGASPTRAVRLVLLPLLLPAIFASFMIVFADSIDDFVIVRYLSAGANTETIPIKIYSTVRGAPTPALNALASLMLFSTLIAITLGFLVYRMLTKGERGHRTLALGDFAAQICEQPCRNHQHATCNDGGQRRDLAFLLKLLHASLQPRLQFVGTLASPG